MNTTDSRNVAWQRSSTCADSACVEVAGSGEHVYLRDGKSPDSGLLCVTRSDWEGFRSSVRLGHFDTM